MVCLAAMTWSGWAAVGIAVACLFVLVGVVFIGSLLLSGRVSLPTSLAPGSLPPPTSFYVAPSRAEPPRLDRGEKPAQKTTREFTAWALDDQELAYVLQLAKDGYESQAIEVLQLRIDRKTNPNGKPAPTTETNAP